MADGDWSVNVSKDKDELPMILQDALRNGLARITFAEERHIDKAAIGKEEEAKQRIKVGRRPSQHTGRVDLERRDSTNAVRLSGSWNRLPPCSLLVPRLRPAAACLNQETCSSRRKRFGALMSVLFYHTSPAQIRQSGACSQLTAHPASSALDARYPELVRKQTEDP
eukprot:281237-Rhodomonas_salina.1